MDCKEVNGTVFTGRATELHSLMTAASEKISMTHCMDDTDTENRNLATNIAKNDTDDPDYDLMNAEKISMTHMNLETNIAKDDTEQIRNFNESIATKASMPRCKDDTHNEEMVYNMTPLS